MSTTSTLRRPLKLISKAAFRRMSVYARRVAVAKDAIARLKSRHLIAKAEQIFTDLPFEGDEDATTTQLLVNEGGPLGRCVACAKGALLLTWVGNFDSMSARSVLACSSMDTDGWPDGLVKVFGVRLLDAIETAFEKQHYGWCRGISGVEGQYLIPAFNIGDDTDRLIAIFANIVKHKGRLVVKHSEGELVID